jgi:D-3-phosphoglycerate dehydrogenase
MFNILTLNKISPVGLDLLGADKYTCGDDIDNPDAVIGRSASMFDMAFGDNLLAIARAGAGVNNIPIDECTQKGIAVVNTPGANANAVKELVLCGMLISSRNVPAALDWCKTLKGEGAQVGKLVEKGKSAFTARKSAAKLSALSVWVPSASWWPTPPARWAWRLSVTTRIFRSTARWASARR